MCSWRSRPRAATWPIWPSVSAPISPSSAPSCPSRWASPTNSRAAGCALVGPRRRPPSSKAARSSPSNSWRAIPSPPAASTACATRAADAYKTVAGVSGPVVLKADGLCAGKGVLVTSSQDEARSFIARVMESREFGEGGARLLIEEALTGRELSYMVLADGRALRLPRAQPRSQARLRRRSGTEHRRHGRLLQRRHSSPPTSKSASCRPSFAPRFAGSRKTASPTRASSTSA